MSHLDAVRSERRRVEERQPSRRRLGVFGTVALLMLAVAVGAAEIRLLPSFNAEDFSSILFGAG